MKRTLYKMTAVLLLAMFSALAFGGETMPYTQATFDRLAEAHKPVLLAVHASWCPTCKAQKPVISSLEARPEFKDLTVLVVDFDTAKPLLQRLKVGMQSTLIAFKAGKEVGRTVGDISEAGIEALMKKSIS